MSLNLSLQIANSGVGSTTAWIYYEVSGVSFPSGAFNTECVISKLVIGDWSREGSLSNYKDVKLTDLKRGSRITISGWVQVTRSWSSISGYDAYGQPITTNHSDSLTASDKVVVYTHPGPWDWRNYISAGDIIQEKLTADLVNTWVDHLAAWKSWDTQANHYSDYNATFNPKTGLGYKVEKGKPIYL